MKLYKSILPRVTIFITLFVLIFSSISAIFIPKWPGYTSRMETFYNQPKNSIDVLILGSSAYLRGIIPLIFWDKYGFTGYNRATVTQSPIVTYYYLVEALKYQHPKVLVIDGISIYPKYNVDNIDLEAKIRYAIDPMRYSVEKFQLINEVVERSIIQTSISYYFPLFRYHTRWINLEQLDFESYKINYHDHFRGSEPFLVNQPFDIPIDFMKPNTKSIQFDKDAYIYFERIIKLCKQNDIEIVFASLPHLASWNYAKHMGLQTLAQENNAFFIDYNLPEMMAVIKLDTQKDFYNSSHLNLSGALKVTSHLGNFLKENFELIDNKSNTGFELWNQDIYFFHKYLKENGFSN